MSETTTEQVTVETPETGAAAPAPTSMLGKWRADIEAQAKALGVEAEKLWALVKEHM